MRFVSGGRGELCVAAAAAAAAAAHNMCLCAHVVCCAYAYVHACMSERVCAPICECVCLHVCVAVCVLCCVWGWWWSHGAALCLSHLPPHSTDTQGNGREGGGGIHFGKRNRGSSGLMGNNAGLTDGPEAKDTGWVCGSQSTNLFDKTVGHPCQALPRSA